MILKNDGKSESHENIRSDAVTKESRKEYTRPQKIKYVLRELSMTSTLSDTGLHLRSRERPFNYKTDCLFCGEIIPDDFHEKLKEKSDYLREKIFKV